MGRLAMHCNEEEGGADLVLVAAHGASHVDPRSGGRWSEQLMIMAHDSWATLECDDGTDGDDHDIVPSLGSAS
jgi:hypothetical protein